MNSIYLDDSLYHLMEAQKSIDLLEPIDPFEEIFEAADIKTAVKLKNNEENSNGAVGHLKAAAQSILNFIRNIISSIRDFFEKRCMDKKQRAAYEEFKKACANNPELKNKKITVMDFKKFNGEYEKLLKEAENADRELAKGKDFPADEILKKITDFCGGAAKGAMFTVGCEAALQWASSSTDVARQMLNQLQTDEKMQQKMVKSLGSGEVKRFEKQLKILTKRQSVRRGIMKLKGYSSTSLQNAIENTIKQVSGMVSAGTKLGAVMPKEDVSKGKVGNVMNKVAAAVTHPKEVAGAVKEFTKGNNASMIRRGAHNKEIVSGVKKYLEVNGKTSAEARQQYKSKYGKKKPRKLQDQSMMDSILGVNDQNSVTNKAKKRFLRK